MEESIHRYITSIFRVGTKTREELERLDLSRTNGNNKYFHWGAACCGWSLSLLIICLFWLIWAYFSIDVDNRKTTLDLFLSSLPYISPVVILLVFLHALIISHGSAGKYSYELNLEHGFGWGMRIQVFLIGMAACFKLIFE